MASGSPLWQRSFRRGLVYGSSTATWQISDPQYAHLYQRESSILFTEDDLLWYRLRPSPTSGIRFTYPDQIVRFAGQNGMLVFGAHLVWDQGFGNGWNHVDFFSFPEKKARHLLFGTAEAAVRRYRGRIAAWSVVNEAVDDAGVRTDVPWYQTVGPGYIAESFHLVKDTDPKAMRVMNDFGFETDYQGTIAADKRAAMLKVLDKLLADNVPVDALGIQAHLIAGGFAHKFDATAYRSFLSEVASRGLKILITEMDVLDDGLPKAVCPRDVGVADVYRRYLDVAMQEPAVVSLMTFGLSDRYTWLQEDFPRSDKAARRPLPFDEKMKPKAAFVALQQGIEGAVRRNAQWHPPRAA